MSSVRGGALLVGALQLSQSRHPRTSERAKLNLLACSTPGTGDLDRRNGTEDAPAETGRLGAEVGCRTPIARAERRSRPVGWPSVLDGLGPAASSGWMVGGWPR